VRLLCLTVACAFPALIAAQNPLLYSSLYNLSRLEFQLPFSGPGAAVFNPSRLTEINRAEVQVGRFKSLSGKAGRPFLQAGANTPFGLALGIAGSWESSSVDNTATFFTEGNVQPMLAYGFPVAGSHLDFGVALPIYFFDAFSAVKSSTEAYDLGAQWTGPAAALGRFQIGGNLRNLFADKAKVANGGKARLNLTSGEVSLDWTSPGQRWELFWLTGMQFHGDAADGAPQKDKWYKSYGFEYRPKPWLGFKWEVTRDNQFLPYGVLLHLKPLTGWDANLEGDIYHQRFLRPPLPDFIVPDKHDEGLGTLVGFSLGVGI
jgi:hypothetical protein